MEELTEKTTTFFSSFPTVSVKKNTAIIRETDQEFSIYYLKKGLVRQYTTTKDGDEITLQIFKPGSFFPIMLVLAEAQNTYTFVAIEDCILHRASPADSLAFISDNPDVLLDLTKRFSKGIVGLVEKIRMLSYENSYTKLISILLYLAKTHGESTDKHTRVTIRIPLTHQEIATFIGLQRETVSRQMDRLIKKGLISSENRSITIHDLANLKNEIEFELHEKP